MARRLTLDCFTGHVIYNTTDISGGYIPDSQIESSVNVLNTDYASCGVSFSLAGIDRTLNGAWFTGAGPGKYVYPSRRFFRSSCMVTNVRSCSSLQTAMKNQLRKGGANALNVYSVGFVSGSGAGLLGYATFPWGYSASPKEDGVVIIYSSVPGGTFTRYNTGRTLTHETG